MWWNEADETAQEDKNDSDENTEQEQECEEEDSSDSDVYKLLEEHILLAAPAVQRTRQPPAQQRQGGTNTERINSQDHWAPRLRPKFVLEANAKESLLKQRLMEELVLEQRKLREFLHTAQATTFGNLNISGVATSLGLFQLYSDLAAVADHCRRRRNHRIEVLRNRFAKIYGTDQWNRMSRREQERMQLWQTREVDSHPITLPDIVQKYIPCFLTMYLEHMHLTKFEQSSQERKGKADEYRRVNKYLASELFLLDQGFDGTVDDLFISTGLHPTVTAMVNSFNHIFSKFCMPTMTNSIPTVVDDIKLTASKKKCKKNRNASNTV